MTFQILPEPCLGLVEQEQQEQVDYSFLVPTSHPISFVYHPGSTSKIIYMPFNDKYIQLTTLNCLALALSSCCSTASACWVLWISKVAPMGWLDVGGGEEWSQLVRLEQIEPKQLGKRTEDNVVQYTEAPMHMYNTELMRLLVELAISWRPNT